MQATGLSLGFVAVLLRDPWLSVAVWQQAWLYLYCINIRKLNYYTQK